MRTSELLRWQWEGYPRYHRSRFNLLLHIVAVPMFMLGNLALLWAAFQWSWPVGLATAVSMVLSLAIQGRGHRHEPVPPEPFTSSGNAVLRIFLAQWATFPRFVISGGCSRALRRRSAP